MVSPQLAQKVTKTQNEVIEAIHYFDSLPMTSEILSQALNRFVHVF